MERRERSRRWVGLRAFDLFAIVFVIAFLGMSLATLVAIHDTRLSGRAQRWLHVTAEHLLPLASVSQAEALPSSQQEPPTH